MTGLSRRTLLDLARSGPIAAAAAPLGIGAAHAQSTGKTLTVAIPAGPTTLI